MTNRILLSVFLLAAPALAGDISRHAVVVSMNDDRARFNLPPLREDPSLDAAAEDRMRDMEDLGYWGHESPDGRSPFAVLARHGYSFDRAAENLAEGFETTELLESAWMESPGHRQNILSPDFTDCGVALLDGAPARRAPGKSVVVLFGRRAPNAIRAATPRSHP